MITETIARKVLEVVDAGLVNGLGKPILGQMCVEAAVCFAMGLPHSDKPDCVSPALRELEIRLNDAHWSSNAARTAGLRRLALAQLGSAGVLDEREFVKRVAELAIRKAVPFALRAAADVQKDGNKATSLRAAADVCEREGTRESAQKANKVACIAYAAYAASTSAYAAYAAYAYEAASASYAVDASAYAAYAVDTSAAYAYDAASASYASVRDKFLAEFCESVVQILIQMNAPGCQWLALTEAVVE